MYFEEQTVAVFRAGQVKAALDRKRLILTATSGRSGTKLLTSLLVAASVDAEHEPSPRINFVLPGMKRAPEFGLQWLVSEKLPTIARRPALEYVETSHLWCKGLLEPVLALGLRPGLIILRRDPQQVARSLYLVNAVPGRTEGGRFALLAPNDRNVVPLLDAESASDYQLCYWYALEIERRQSIYAAVWLREGWPLHQVTLPQLLEHEPAARVASFCAGSERGLSPEAHAAVVSINQNPREAVRAVGPARELPACLDDQERDVHARLIYYDPSLAGRF